MDKLTVIVPAAGAGKRLGLGKNKVFAMLGGLPLLVQCLRMINDTGMADKTIIAAGAAEIDDINKMLARCRDLFPLLDGRRRRTYRQREKCACLNRQRRFYCRA